MISMEGVKRSRSLRVFAAKSENDISPKRSKSARFELLDRTKLLESRAPGSRQKFRFPDSERANVVGIAAPDSASTEQFFDVEIPGALNATGVFRSRSQRVYVSELPESLQSVVAESQSARYSSSAVEDVTGLNSKSSQRFYDASKDGFEPAAEQPGTKNKNASLKKAKKSRAHRQSVPYFKLFKYADSIDVLLMTVGTICAIVDGLIWPAIAYVQARIVSKFASLLHSDPELAAQKISSYALILVYISIVSGLASYLEISCWMYTGERQAGRIRAKYVRAILRQNVGYFDTESSNTAAVVSSVSADTMLLQDAISEKVSNTIQNVMQMAGGLALGFYLSWRLALSIVPFLPFLVLPGLMYGRALLDLAVRIQIAYGKAGIVAEQAISAVRTVYSFVEEKRTLQTFSKYLEGTVNLGKKQGLAKGLAVGLTGQTFLAWAFAMWYGTYQFTHGMATGAEVVFCAFIILFAGLGLGSIAPNIKCMMEGCVAAYRIFEMIERVPPIDIDDHSQGTLEKVDGNLELRNVDFAYPSRIHAQIFRNFNLQIPAGRTVALVGNSGSGKSTVVALLERFYDPSAGQVLIDGVDIKNLQLKWLRNQIGLVSQEPALFATSIVANILYGKDHSSMEEVIEAAKSANAHNFISQLPDGYETQVGERGVQLSGGQKQRIAIARTMLKKPPVLLLDEATSALDAESEKVVQQALEAAAVGRTTVVVAHRLSTVRNADTIAVLQLGKVVEMGSHTELMARGPGGAYCALVNLQASSQVRALTPDIAKASVAINAVFEIIDRKTEIDADVVDAEKLTKVEGQVELKNVSFAYPSRPDIMVLKGFNLKVQAGRSAAMVGQSGSGKSTIIGLLERFYDPLQGAVFVDGRNLKTMNLQSVRLHIALVSQEPTLFAMSIHDNIAYGKDGATEAEIIEAAGAANAHNFISAMPEGYATFAGDRGLQLSGGQKQRIAIARAILKNPKILLLDEATSALDAESEQVVQEALDRMMVGRTTLIVAHRLSTIQNADTIAVLQGGVILEQGRHAELLSKGEKGAYYNLVHLQTATH
ncbi:unnamed protein product [Sphagnum jensenii]|uniref:Uncharacterized protein n=1 Tax=Sphagnum jensenii TaxID=128206 RepID=A0ABP1BRU4_9BRYO